MRVQVMKKPPTEGTIEPRVCLEVWMTTQEAKQYALPCPARDQAIEDALHEHLSGGRHRTLRQVHSGKHP